MSSIPSFALSADLKTKVVMIDPGHGGDDLGTVFDYGTTTLAEKDIALALSLETARLLRPHGVKVLLTRDSDLTLTLKERTQKANNANATIFVSIHLNSQKKDEPLSPTAQGIETYFLNGTTNASSGRLAQIENNAKNETPQDSVHLILKDLKLDQNQNSSRALACQIQNHMSSGRGYPKSRGVKQALFYVLLGADMPAVLVEAGFLSHPTDRQNLLSPKGRETLSQHLSQGILDYLKSGTGPPCPVIQ